MTDQPQGRDAASPSIAALAVCVDELRREAEGLAAKVKKLASTQRQQAVLLEGLAELRQQIDRILSTLTEQDEDGPTTWFWLTMSEHERDEKLSELADWVETVLRVQYPDYLADHIKPCWQNHPEARWELAWLYQQWLLAYLAERRAPRDAADWHDCWSPGVIRRLTTVMGKCGEDCLKQPRHEMKV